MLFDRLTSFYRAKIVSNDDPENKGRVKAFAYGVYPEEFLQNFDALPWAEPAALLFAGNYTADSGSLNSQTGVCSVPKVGAVVFVFFEGGDQNSPIYFAASQGGDGWLLQHNKQNVIQTNNVKVRIDDDPTNAKSTKFNAYANGTETSISTTVEIEVKGNVNIIINGSVNLKVTGNVYEEITGKKYEKITGDVTKLITGNVYETIIGSKSEVITGDAVTTQTGNVTQNINGNVTVNTVGGLFNINEL